MVYKLFVFITCLGFLSGCSTDPYSGYLGLWEQQKAPLGYVVMEITRDGDTLLLQDNIFNKTTLTGLPNVPQVLKKTDGQLSFPRLFGDIQLGLSADRKVLRMGDRVFTKINLARVAEIKVSMKKARAAWKRDTQLCDSLKAEFKGRSEAITSRFTAYQWKEQAKLLDPLRATYNARAGEIPHCVVFF